jgi:exodeoxyribonuclease V beta subunit
MSNSRTPLILDASKTLEIPLTGVKLIEASAGTGKTYTIANLYLRHILAGRSPEQILVVTFTNAATEELRGRIRARIYDTLQRLSQPTPSEDEFLSLLLEQWQDLDEEAQTRQCQHLQLALRCMDQAAIFTIHGFCQRTLTDHALSSGQPFDTTLLNDDQQIWDDALKDWWRKQSYTLDSGDWYLFHSCLGDLSTLLASQKNFRTGHIPVVLPRIDEDLPAIYKSWRLLDGKLQILATEWQKNKDTVLEILKTSKALSRANKLPYHKDNLMQCFDQWEAYFASEQRLVIPDSLQYLCSDTLDDCSTATKRGTDPNLQDGFFVATQQIFNRINQIKLNFRVRALVEANSYAHQRVRNIKQETGIIGYQDQLNLLLEALNNADGPILAEKLRESFPVAMIDEFQDTDAIQYGIFKKLYFADEYMGAEDISLTMIGDPKQAIYSFRGGDIFTYIKARQEPSVQHYSLLANWRSGPELINAVNSIFTNRLAPFIYANSIDYAPVQAAQKEAAALLIDDSKVTALTIWRISQNQENKNLSSEISYDLINAAIAEEIAYLINGGIQNLIKIGTKPIRSGDIAILVRTAREGNKLRAVLAERDIRAVTIGKDKVFDSEEASGLYDLLIGINHHTDRDLLRAALASPLMNLDYIQIAAIIDDDVTWQDWQDKFRKLHLLWQHQGFIAMFQQLLQLLEIAQRIIESSFAERRLTNLLHLAELAQQQSRISPGFDALLAWYRAQIVEQAVDDTELRLENDEDLVKIVTIHKSKGLEYPVVFAPFLWTCRPRPVKPDSVLLFHDEDHNPVIDLGSDEHTQNRFIAEKERLAEDIRLAYVAITRACAKVYLAWGDVGDGKMSGQPAKTALGYLFHPAQSATDLDTNFPWAFNSGADVNRDLDTLVNNSEGSIEVIPLPQPTNGLKMDLSVNRAPLEAAAFKRKPGVDWQIASFTGLTRDIHQVAHGGSSGISGDSILDFPAGSHVGLLLHSLLEHLDFQGDIQAQCADLLPLYAPRFDLDSADYRKTLCHWMETLMTSPLNPGGLTLSALSTRQRLNELAFDFSLDSFSVDKLNHLLANISGDELTPINVDSFRGLITGVIDLVFEYQGKYYLADYKSNYLGASLGDYTQQNLKRAIFDRRYDLQYLLYSVALHRYLSQRIPDYQYERHFGGVYYLFIRAMRPSQQPLHGVYFELPNYADLNALDTLMSGSPIDN